MYEIISRINGNETVIDSADFVEQALQRLAMYRKQGMDVFLRPKAALNHAA